MGSNSVLKGSLLVFFAALFWSTSGVCIKYLDASPIAIVGFRSGAMAVLFTLFIGKKVWMWNKMHLWLCFFYALMVIAFVFAMKNTTASNAIFLQYLCPVYIMIIEPRIFNFPFPRKNLILIAICLLGMLILLSDQIGSGHTFGNVLGVISGFGMAGLFIVQKKLPEQSQFPAVMHANLFVFLIASFFSFNEWLSLDATSFWVMVYLGVIQMGLGYALFILGMRHIKAFQASLISMLEPILVPIWVAIFLNEKITITAIIGGSFILLGLILQVLWQRKKKPSTEV